MAVQLMPESAVCLLMVSLRGAFRISKLCVSCAHSLRRRLSVANGQSFFKREVSRLPH